MNIRDEQLRLFLADAQGEPLKSFGAVEASLAAHQQKLSFAMNAGMYEPDYSPVGLLIVDGRQVRPLNSASGSGNFYLKPNGVFLISEGGARVVDSLEYPALQLQPSLATQSGPLLLRDGNIHQAFRADSKSRLIRNGVGIVSRDVVVFAISEEPVNFHEFASLFRDQLKCRDALYLDGTVSSLFSRSMNRNDAGYPLGPIIGVVE